MNDSFNSNPTRRVDGGDTPVMRNNMSIVEVGASPRPTPSTSRNKRRQSSHDKFALTQHYIRANFEKLTAIWDDVKMSESARLARLESFFAHIHGIIDDMVTSEEQMAESVKEEIQKGRRKIKFMEREMDKRNRFETELYDGSIAMLRAVEKETDRLAAEYVEKRKEQDELMEKLSLLIYRVGSSPEFLDNLQQPEKVEAELDDYRTKLVMRLVPLSVLRGNVLTLEDELTNKLITAHRMQADLRKWSDKLGNLLTGDENTCLLEADLDSEDFSLSNDFIENMEQFHKQLGTHYAEWLSDQEMQWTELHQRLSELWDQCHVAQSERFYAATFDPVNHDNDDFDGMRREIESLQAVFESRQGIYRLMDEWKTSWNLKIGLEEKKKSIDYYKSVKPGNNLIQDLKVEKDLMTKIPRLVERVTREYEAYTIRHPEDTIRVEGFTPPDYVQYVMEEHRLEAENAANRKAELKSTAMNSPLKSGLRTPSRAGRAEPPAKRPLLSLNCSQMSTIGPTHPQTAFGPKASTPKQSMAHALPQSPRRVGMGTRAATPVGGFKTPNMKRAPFINVPSPSPTNSPRTAHRK